MSHRRLMTARNERWRAVTRPDVVQGADDVDLADHPFPGVFLTEGEITKWYSTTAVDADVPAFASNVEQVFMDGQAIGGIDPSPPVIYPGRIVDQPAEDGTTFDDILEIASVGTAVRMRCHMPDPGPGIPVVIAPPAFDIFPVVIDPLIHLVEVFLFDRVFQDDIPMQIEQIFDQIFIFLTVINPILQHPSSPIM